jgi:hypothetical protein
MRFMNSALLLPLKVIEREVKKSTGRKQQKQSTATLTTPSLQLKTKQQIESQKQIESLFTTASFPGSFAKFVQ